MSQEISKNLMCVQIRGDIEVWMESERVEKLMGMLAGDKAPRFINYEGRMFNTADIVGIFPAADIDARTRRRNGQWQGKDGSWNNRGDYPCSICGSIIPKGKFCGRCV